MRNIFGSNITIANMQFTDNSFYGLLFNNGWWEGGQYSHNVLIENNSWKLNTTPPNSPGMAIYFSVVKDSVIRNNVIVNTSRFIAINMNTGDYNVTIENNTIINADVGAITLYANSIFIKVKGNIILNTLGYYAIRILGCVSCDVSHNFIDNSSSDGIYIEDTYDNNNTKINNNRISFSKGNGIIFDTGLFNYTNTFVIESNSIVNNSKNGIFSSFANYTILVRNNLIINNGFAGINNTNSGRLISAYNLIWNNNLNVFV